MESANGKSGESRSSSTILKPSWLITLSSARKRSLPEATCRIQSRPIVRPMRNETDAATAAASSTTAVPGATPNK